MQRNYEPNADHIVSLYQQLEDDILSAIVKRLLKMGYVSESSKHQIAVLQAAGLLYDDIIQLIADRTNASTAQVKALFEDAGVQTVAIDNAIHEEAGELPIDIRQDAATKQVLEAGYKKTLGTMQNLVSTTANNAQTAFIQTCDRIYMQVSSGAFSYQEAIRFALRELADTGAYITYPTKHRDRIDVAVRRCVLTGVGQTAAAVAKKQAEDSGCEYMELTAHSGARPEHAKWQGQLVIIKGERTQKYIDGLKVFTLSDIGYGDGAGFKGWNCCHNWHPYYVGYSTPNYTQKELKKLDEPCIPYNGTLYTEYEISQMQRAGERKVRAWKRRCITAQEGVNSAADDATKATAQAEYSKSAVHLKATEEKLKDFCKQTGQDRDRFREQVYGFGRSEAQRAVQANNSNFRNTMQQKGIKNPPKSLAEFEKMKYNNPKEYDLMQSYSKSVDSGMMSPLVGYEKYKEYHHRVETELIGLTTSNGIQIQSQSKHFLERVFGTISDPSHGGVIRSGVELEDIADTLKNGKIKRRISQPDSIAFFTDKCIVTVNPKTGNLIQTNPQKRK